MSQNPQDLLPQGGVSLSDTDGSLLLIIVGALAFLLVGYLVFDHLKTRRRARRFEALRRRAPD
jgi:hypothetical protein